MRLLAASPVLLLCTLFVMTGCSGKNDTSPVSDSPAYAIPDSAADTEKYVQEPYDQTPPAERQSAARNKAAAIAAALDDRQLAAQLIISGIDGKGALTSDMHILFAECPAGGTMLFRYNLDADNDAIRGLNAETAALIAPGATVTVDQTSITILPFAAVDHEGGLVNRFRAGVADLPPAIRYWELAQNGGDDTAITRINTDSFNAGSAIKRLGINMNFAPVAEYLNKDNSDFLEERSYGPDPAFTAKAAGAFIAGMEQAGILCVVKHFPGSAGADPHLFPSVLSGSRAAITELIAPFTALIGNNQARAFMIAHSEVPALDSAIASLSSVIMGGWLRQELGFDGLIICDDFSMAAASSPVAASGPAAAGAEPLKPESAAVLSLAAGADMVLVWPPDLRRTHRAILAALDNGDLSRERLREAAARIIHEKMHMNLIEERYNGK